MKILRISFYFMLSMCITTFAISQVRKTIYVYEDEGVSKESLNQTLSTFQNLLKRYPIKTINAQQIKEGAWTNHAILLVIPGGADLPYGKKLNGKGNIIIKKYVENGGAFLGICAGAYYGSSSVIFDKNGPLEVLGDRELSFFKGNAIGPILAPYDYKTQSGARAATIETIVPNTPQMRVFYNGGGFFENAEQYPNTKVIGTYKNNLPAIILINYGKGRVLLSGVHFEYDPALLDSKDQHLHKIMAPLHQSNPRRKILFYYLMKLIDIK